MPDQQYDRIEYDAAYFTPLGTIPQRGLARVARAVRGPHFHVGISPSGVSSAVTGCLYYIIEGEIEIKSSNKWKICKPGDFFLKYSNNILEQKSRNGNYVTRYEVIFSYRYFKALFARYSQLRPGVIIPKNSHQARQVLEMLLREAKQQSPYAEEICEDYFRILIRKLAEGFHSRKTGVSWFTYVKCKRYMEQHRIRLPTVAVVARECSVSAPYLWKLFQRFSQISPKEYLLRLKMEEAIECLARPEMTIKEIAYKLKFSDPFSFSKTFKRLMGIPPTQYRMNLKA